MPEQTIPTPKRSTRQQGADVPAERPPSAEPGPVDLMASVAQTTADTVLGTAGTIADTALTVAGAAVSAAGAAAGAAAGVATSAAGAAASAAGAAAGMVAGTAAAAAGAARPVLSAVKPVIEGVDRLADEARRGFNERPGARVREIRARARQPLPSLYKLHPEARNAVLRDLGLLTVKVDEIRGSAVEGPDQRGGDFLPLKEFRSDNWRARWQRLQHAVDGLVDLPPIELLRFGDGYWVVDGHNRVAAALYVGQIEIEAIVQELRLPGMRSQPRGQLGAALQGSRTLRAAASGRLSRTANTSLEETEATDAVEREADRDAGRREGLARNRVAAEAREPEDARTDP